MIPISRYDEEKVELLEETAASTKPGEEPRIFEILDKLEQLTDSLNSRWFINKYINQQVI